MWKSHGMLWKTRCESRITKTKSHSIKVDWLFNRDFPSWTALTPITSYNQAWARFHGCDVDYRFSYQVKRKIHWGSRTHDIFLEIYCHPPHQIYPEIRPYQGAFTYNNLLIRPYLLGEHWAGTLRFSWHLLIWVPWSQWILKIDAGCNHQTCFDSYVVTSILEDGSLVSSSSFMPLCYLKESRQCLKEPVILSNQKKNVRWLRTRSPKRTTLHETCRM